MHTITEPLEEATRIYELGRFTEAENRFRQLVRECPENPLHYQGLGLSLLRLGRHDEAISAFAKALELEPQLSTSHGALGQIFLRQRKYEVAKAELETAVQIAPNDFVARTVLGVLYLEQGMYDEATRELEMVIGIDPQQAPAHVNLGKVYVLTGKLAKGISAYWKAVQLDPGMWGYIVGGVFNIPLIYIRRLPAPLKVALAIILVLLILGHNPLSWPIWIVTVVIVVLRSILYIFVERQARTGILLLLAIALLTILHLMQYP